MGSSRDVGGSCCVTARCEGGSIERPEILLGSSGGVSCLRFLRPQNSFRRGEFGGLVGKMARLWIFAIRGKSKRRWGETGNTRGVLFLNE